MTLIPYAIATRYASRIKLNKKPNEWGTVGGFFARLETGEIARGTFDYVAERYAESIGLDAEGAAEIAREDSAVVEIAIFPGFYESSLSYMIDNAAEQWVEYEAERLNSRKWRKASDSEIGEEYDATRRIVPGFTIDQERIASAHFSACNWRDCYQALAVEYVAALESFITGELDRDLFPIAFESISSPREYNFTTDRLFCFIPWNELERMRAELPPVYFARMIRDRFTSYDGFISSYSNAFEEWRAKPLRDFDHNESGTLFAAWLYWKAEQAGLIDPPGKASRRSRRGDLASLIEERLDSGNGEIDSCLDAGTDFAAIWAELREAMAEAVAEWREENPGEPLPYRCNLTPDMFEQSNGYNGA